jgi:phosphohistidine phosphatase SixA
LSAPTLIVLRHGHAVARSDWRGPDLDRPLRGSGRHQAAALVPLARTHGIRRVLSSPATRCVQTVAGMLVDADARVELLPGLGEDATPPQRSAALQVVSRLSSGEHNALVCSHRPVLPQLFEALAAAGGPAPPDEPLRPGEYIVMRGADLLLRGRS